MRNEEEITRSPKIRAEKLQKLEQLKKLEKSIEADETDAEVLEGDAVGPGEKSADAWCVRAEADAKDDLDDR